MKKILSFLFFLLVSCANIPNQNTKEKLIKINSIYENSHDLKWNNFLNNESIENLLKFTFNNTEEKNKYIAEQKQIDNEIYFQKIKDWTNYFTYINAKIVSQSKQKLTYSIKTGNETLSELITKNWLWFLANINHFTYIFFPVLDLYQQSNENYLFNIMDGNLTNGGFYYPNSNHYIDYASAVLTNNLYLEDLSEYESYKIEKNFYLMNKDGFIVYLNINKYFDDEKKLKSTNIDLIPYLFSYTELLKSKNKKNFFSLSKYIQNNFDFEGIENNNTNKILFNDYYGGEILRYSFIGINKK